MKYCLKCGRIIADNSLFKDDIICCDCKIPLEEDGMTSKQFNSLSEQEKEEYTQSLLNKIRKSNIFNNSLCEYETPKFYVAYWFDKYEALTGDVAARCGDDLKQHMQATYGKGSKLYEEAVVQNCIQNERAKKQENENIPRCPTCQSSNIEKISLTKKAVGGALFGLFSSNIRKTMHCKNCGAKW